MATCKRPYLPHGLSLLLASGRFKVQKHKVCKTIKKILPLQLKSNEHLPTFCNYTYDEKKAIWWNVSLHIFLAIHSGCEDRLSDSEILRISVLKDNVRAALDAMSAVAPLQNQRNTKKI